MKKITKTNITPICDRPSIVYIIITMSLTNNFIDSGAGLCVLGGGAYDSLKRYKIDKPRKVNAWVADKEKLYELSEAVKLPIKWNDYSMDQKKDVIKYKNLIFE